MTISCCHVNDMTTWHVARQACCRYVYYAHISNQSDTWTSACDCVISSDCAASPSGNKLEAAHGSKICLWIGDRDGGRNRMSLLFVGSSPPWSGRSSDAELQELLKAWSMIAASIAFLQHTRSERYYISTDFRPTPSISID